jgi:hypothetical protein
LQASPGLSGDNRHPISGFSAMLPWWITGTPAANWTREENRTYSAIYGVFCIAFILLYGVSMWLVRVAGLPHSTGNVIALIVSVPIALYVSRRYCARRWADMVKKADENAAGRLARRLRVR